MNSRDQLLKAIVEVEAQITRLDQARQQAALALEKLHSQLVVHEDGASKQFAKYAPPEEKVQNDVIQVLTEKRFPLILTERREHLELLHDMLKKVTSILIVLHGGKSAKAREGIMQQLKDIPETEGRVILATGAYIGEGFDDRRLDTLFLAMPISFKGKIEQYAGRILRPHPGKEEVRIYDYVDSRVLLLARMFKKRLKAYRAMKYEIEETATQESIL